MDPRSPAAIPRISSVLRAVAVDGDSESAAIVAPHRLTGHAGDEVGLSGGETIDLMTTATGDFELTIDELRVVARYVAEAAQEVLPVFEDANPGDPRPRAALDAAWEFVNGAHRTQLQRVTSLDAHRAAKAASTEASRLAAQAAGDAASAAYLHPIAKAHQVGHILRAAANAARIAEINAGGDRGAGDRMIEQARERATPVLIGVLHRYPRRPAGKSRAAQLMAALETSLRTLR